MKNILLGIVLLNFIMVCFIQFLTPLLAKKAKERAHELGHSINADYRWCFMITSKFWAEAREILSIETDRKYNILLNIYQFYVFYSVVSFASLTIFLYVSTAA